MARTWLKKTVVAAIVVGLAIATIVCRPDRPRRPGAVPKAPSPQLPGPRGRTAMAHGATGETPSEYARAAGPESIRLDDVTGFSGIAFVHTDGSSGRKYPMETMAGGMATVDFDGDGLIDIYFPNGAVLPGAASDVTPHHALYRNLGGGRFQDVTREAGVASTAFGMGIACGDYDGDGFADIYLSNFGPNVLYHNNGDGTFSDATAQAGVARGNRVGAGAAFLDMDGDGQLDLFVANYVQFSFAAHRPYVLSGLELYPGPLDQPPETNLLFRNLGDGTFADVSRQSGIGTPQGTGMGVAACDYDQDGATDLLVANDGMPNSLFHNDGRGVFEQVGVAAGVAYSASGMPQSNMGVECGDYDNDGRPDFYITSYRNEWAILYRNLGDGLFLDVTRLTGAGQGTLEHVTWGEGLVDFDNDGDRDVFVACGHTDDNIQARDPGASYRAQPILLKNLLRETGQPRFVNVSDRCGDGLRVVGVGRGVCCEDLDNDGDVDVVLFHLRGTPSVLRNMLQENGCRNHWLEVRLHGERTNREGIGAQVRVVAGDLTQIDEVHAGRGYQSHWGSRLHFGLGPHDRVERIEVRWIGGGVDVFENLGADRLVTLAEGQGSKGQTVRKGPQQSASVSRHEGNAQHE